MPEPRTIALSSLGMSPEEVAGRSFATVRRGFDPDAVRRFLEEVAGLVRQSRVREAELQGRLADAEQRAASPVLDESVLSAALGAETARVLQVAHEAAQEVVQKAEQRAEALLEEASTVYATRSAAAEAEAARVLEEARRTAEEIVQRTKAECRSMLEQARAARRRVLDDLGHRRHDLHGQIDQLRAAKDALTAVFADAAQAVDGIRARLSASEDEAREAAGQVARALHPEGVASAVLDELGAALAGEEEADDEAATEADLAAILPGGHTTSAPDAGLDMAAGAGLDVAVQVAGDREAVDLEDHLSSAAALSGGPGPAVDEAGAVAPWEVDPVETGAPAEEAEPEALEPEEATAVEEPGPAMAVGDGHWSDEATAVEEPRTTLTVDEVGGSGTVSDTGSATRAGPEAPSQAGSSVDALFARIRASRAAEAARAKEVLAGPAGTDSAARRVGPVGEGSGETPPPTAAMGATDGVEEGEGAAVRRDEALEPLQAEVARALKRVLRSQQNELLDAARGLKLTEAGMLRSGEAAVGQIAEAVTPAVVAAWRAGREHVGDPGAAQADTAGAVEIAIFLAQEIVGAIDGRVGEGVGSLVASGSNADDALGEVVGVAYRDWKGGRIDALAAEVVLRAYAAGSVAGAEVTGLRLRWVLESPQPCPDCDDNALSEPLAPGDAFPTGQPQPPLHSGCRCVLVAVPG